MNFRPLKYLLITVVFAISGCQKSKIETQKAESAQNSVRHATGLAIYRHDGYSLVKVSNPWPNSQKNYTYILKSSDAKIPDSLASYETIRVPVKKLVVTSTTHIPSLEMLGVENALVGFPTPDYISSENVRRRIDAGKVRNLGMTTNLNTELTLELQPDVIVAHGIDDNNPSLDNLRKSGLKIMLNGDWNEPTALGKAEWIKLFGALFGLESKADSVFKSIETEYNRTLALAQRATNKPTVLSGAIYENRWYLPQGESWGSVMLAQAGGDYLWRDTKGTGSLSLSFESVLEKAVNADFWIGPGQFTTLQQMTGSNPHYAQFKAYKNKNVYSYSSKKGKTGGVIYFELAPNRPDLVLKDLVKILHPELLPDYKPYFFEKLK